MEFAKGIPSPMSTSGGQKMSKYWLRSLCKTPQYICIMHYAGHTLFGEEGDE